MGAGSIYETKYGKEHSSFEQEVKEKHLYFFNSTNEDNSRIVTKVIEYNYLQTEFQDCRVFNLGFGDYNNTTKDLRDDVMTANGDVRTVFNTVLSSVPEFFSINKNVAIFISGSDSTDDFETNCREGCEKKKCQKGECRKKHQRIKTYCAYINRQYEVLINEYDFFGGNVCQVTDRTILEPYKKEQFYDAVLVKRKN